MKDSTLAALKLTGDLVTVLRNWLLTNKFAEVRVPLLRNTSVHPTIETCEVQFSGQQKARLCVGDNGSMALAALKHWDRVFVMSPSFRPESRPDFKANRLDEYTYLELYLRGSFVDALSVAANLLANLLDTFAKHGSISPEQRELLQGCAQGHQTFMYSEIIKRAKLDSSSDMSFGQELDVVNAAQRKPVVILNSPVGMKPDFVDVKAVDSHHLDFEILLPFSGETMAGGEFQTNPTELRALFAASEFAKQLKAIGVSPDTYDDYLTRLGSFDGQPVSFVGLGFERLAQFLLGAKDISDVVAFNYKAVSEPVALVNDVAK